MAPIGRNDSIEHVESLLAEQQGLFVRLDGLSERQAGLIREDRTDQLLDVLAERQVVVDEISRISTQLEPWRGNWSEFVRTLGEDVRKRVRERIDAVAALAQRIAERDERDRKMLESRKDAVAGELGQVDRGRSAMSAYGGSAARGSNSPRFQDREA